MNTMNAKTAEEKVESGEMVTGNFTIQAQMPMGKSLTMSGYIYSHNSVESVNAQVDLMTDVIDRQRIRAEIPELEAKLDQRFIQLKQLRDHMAGLESKRDSGKALSSAEKKMIGDLNTNVGVILADIEKGEQAIVAAKAKAGKV